MRLLVTCHRRESWGDGLQSIASALRVLARRGDLDIDVILHPNEHVADAMRASLARLAGHRAARAVQPRRARRPDARGNAGAERFRRHPGRSGRRSGAPLLVLREKTERPEGVECGNARLVGTSAERIVGEVERLIADPAALAAMGRRSYPYGDGHSAPRIAAIVGEWLEAHGALSVGSQPVPRTG